MEPKRFIIVDDDRLTAGHARAVLQKAGHKVTVFSSSIEGLDAIRNDPPDAVLTDVMMPEMDGMELTQKLREDPTFDEMKIFVFSGKAFEYDRARAMELGADAYILKPIKAESFIATVDRILGDKVEARFWGVRGTLPKPGPNALKYGGHTSCITLSFPRGQFFIFDAGSGIREVGASLLASGKTRTEGKIFISHPHWDHINAIPFFAPLYMQGNEFEILGAKQGDITMRELISAQMDGVYFPITLTEFSARTYFRNLEEGTHDVAGIEVQTKLLAHPGRALGYRVNYHGRSFCYVTDQELYLDDSEFFDPHYEKTITEFVRGADVLITDTTYTDEEYKTKVNWGHSCVSKVCELAHNAEVKALYLFHHDPDQDDDAIDAKHAAAQKKLKELGGTVTCVAPREGDNIRL